jgi:hypothetical protein
MVFIFKHIKPYLNRVLTGITTLGAANDITKSFHSALNPALSSTDRMKGLIRGSSCIGTVVFSFAARSSSEPRLARTFNVSSSVFGVVYVFAGGDIALYMAISSNSRFRNERN